MFTVYLLRRSSQPPSLNSLNTLSLCTITLIFLDPIFSTTYLQLTTSYLTTYIILQLILQLILSYNLLYNLSTTGFLARLIFSFFARTGRNKTGKYRRARCTYRHLPRKTRIAKAVVDANEKRTIQKLWAYLPLSRRSEETAVSAACLADAGFQVRGNLVFPLPETKLLAQRPRCRARSSTR